MSRSFTLPLASRTRSARSKSAKKADLIVLEQNLLEIDPHEIYNANVELTMMDGVVRYRNGI